MKKFIISLIIILGVFTEIPAQVQEFTVPVYFKSLTQGQAQDSVLTVKSDGLVTFIPKSSLQVDTSNLVTLNTAQNITADKTFSGNVTFLPGFSKIVEVRKADFKYLESTLTEVSDDAHGGMFVNAEGLISFYTPNNSNGAPNFNIDNTNLSARRVYELQDTDGTLAHTADIPSFSSGLTESGGVARLGGVLDSGFTNVVIPDAVSLLVLGSSVTSPPANPTNITIGQNTLQTSSTNDTSITSAGDINLTNTGAGEVNLATALLDVAGPAEILNDMKIEATNNPSITMTDNTEAITGTITLNGGADAFLVSKDMDLQSNGVFGALIRAGVFRVSTLNTPPASATDTGTLGEVRFTADYIYVCVNTNTWKRVAISTW